MNAIAPDGESAPRRLTSLGAAGVLLSGGGTVLLFGGGENLDDAAEHAAGGHWILTDAAPSPERVESIRGALSASPWNAHVPRAVVESFRRERTLAGRLSAFSVGMSFMIGDVEVDVLPGGPEGTGLQFLLEAGGALVLVPAALPSVEAARALREQFALVYHLVARSTDEGLEAWKAEAPLDDASRARAGGGHLLVQTPDDESWQVWPLSRGDALVIDNETIRPEG